MSKERPILFSGPMVRAILDGHKTQTRRIVVPGRGYQASWLSFDTLLASPTAMIHRVAEGPLDGAFGAQFEHACGGPLTWVRSPYGEPGDRLWVRETWQPIWATDDPPPRGLASAEGWRIGYPATDGVQEWMRDDARANESHITTRCKPSIHMPRWASRITLEITDVRVERLQQIGDFDAVQEGVEGWVHDPRCETPRDAFHVLWDSINAKRALWAANPWVWAVTFVRMDESVWTRK